MTVIVEQEMSTRIDRLGVREGYDRWARSYDRTVSALILLDRRHTPRHLRPRAGERILDAGCGTGQHLSTLRRVGALPVGLDLSTGMLAAARRRNPQVQLVQADLGRALPLARSAFDAVVCSLVSDHLTDLKTCFAELFAVLRPAGRLVFSAFHPQMAAAGIEANFEQDGVEYRLGAEKHTTRDYLDGLHAAGFENVRWRQYRGDERLVEEAPSAGKYLGRALLLLIEAERPK